VRTARRRAAIPAACLACDRASVTDIGTVSLVIGETRAVDDDLEDMSRTDLIAEVKRLRSGIRTHRDSTGHELCWHHPDLWALLPEHVQHQPVVPDWPQFMRGCIQYRTSLDEQLGKAPRSSDEFGG
jgi:hypothetical protein